VTVGDGRHKATASVAGPPWRARRPRRLTLLLIALVVVGAVPAAIVIGEVTRDPVLVALDSLKLPSWAATHPRDDSIGSRWCLRQCRARERTWDSERGIVETEGVYVGAIRDTRWRTWNAPGCRPPATDGIGSCWQRDEYLLSLFVRTPTCEGTQGGGSAGQPGDPLSAAPPPTSAGACPAARATVKIFNRVSLPAGAG
jgi:hypothetical protein